MSDKYITLVIKNPSEDRVKTFKLFEDNENLGEISAMSVGHCLEILSSYEEFVEKIANGEIGRYYVEDLAKEFKLEMDKKYFEDHRS
ncbi:hypothetical protein [Entomomonas asaccharolytica]|uniref:Uncharacterized protein n=1 Tax=Entomomonas asaccharolytica TaxID=2785331 RepID=A0A974NHT7_9GAMM|nr:hypothetical protein [Entomomonas asaccharolytica]QQP86908.1 hypothetical protein JHT90_06600 [Entomomonas asaccharolytica]